MLQASKEKCDMNKVKIEYYSDSSCKNFDKDFTKSQNDPVYGLYSGYNGECLKSGSHSSLIYCDAKAMYTEYYKNPNCDGKAYYTLDEEYGEC